jgi:hypothetical protein
MKHAALTVVLSAALALVACSPSKPAEAPAAPASVAPADVAPAPTSNDPPPTTAANPVPNPADDACKKATYAAIIGMTEKDPSVPAAGPNVRHIHPGDQVTMDFRQDRLNIDIDAKGVITGLRCG